jgi:hypothetical protein
MPNMLVLPAVLLLSLGVQVHGGHAQANPLGKVMDLMTELIEKITKDGEAEAKSYKEYFEWCDDVSKNTDFAIETAKKEKAELEASIGKLSSSITVSGSKIEDLAGAISTADSELKDATVIREKEAADFAASEDELMQTIDALGRAISILEKEMAKNPAAFAQLQGKDSSKILQALSSVLDAAAFSTKDQSKLNAFIQSQQGDSSDDELSAAPAASTYKTHSTGILDVLEDLKEKAEAQLSDLRKAEVNTKHNFEMLKQSLADQLSADEKDMSDEKTSKANSEESKARAEGDLDMTVKVLASSNSQLATARSSCLQVAADHEATVATRKEELKAIEEAKKVLTETSSGAESQTYSFVQVNSLAGIRTGSDLAGFEVVAKVKQLAKKHHSAALAQLASRIAAVMRYSAGNAEDPFAKVKGLIQDMISKLENEAGSEATEKAYCDEQIARTEEKKGELEHDVAKQTSRIDKASSASAQLKEEVQELQGELATLAKAQAEMDKMRQEGHAAYVQAKADLELGLTGVRKALGTLREYYGTASAAMLQDGASFGSMMRQPALPEHHSKAAGAGGSIIDILEVVESDFASNLAKEEMEESDSQADYEKTSQQNAIVKTTKDQDVKYKTQEAKAADATAAEYSADRETTDTELSAVLTYYSKIKERCIAKPEKYGERKERREAEIQGLKEALTILEDETAFVQRKRKGGSFRGTLAM